MRYTVCFGLLRATGNTFRVAVDVVGPSKMKYSTPPCRWPRDTKFLGGTCLWRTWSGFLPTPSELLFFK